MDYEPSELSVVFQIPAVYSIHYFKYNKDFSFEGEQHDFWELVYADAGTVNVVAGNKSVTLKSGQVIFHEPNEFHTVFTKNAFGYVVIVSFACDSAEMKFFRGKILTLGEEEKALLKRIVTEGASTYSDRLNELYLPKLHKREVTPFASEQMIASSLAQFLILCRRGELMPAVKTFAPTRRSAERIDEKIIALLKENLYGEISLQQLENKLYFSKTALKRAFKQKTGKSIIQYYLELKIDESKKLIATGRHSFTQISAQLSFSSVYYFSRLFKQKTDMTPSEYAKSIKTENLI